jgi:hypothetical protein
MDQKNITYSRVIHCDITQKLVNFFSCNDSYEKKLGVQIFELINFLPSIIDLIKKLSERKTFILPAAEPLEFEIYPVRVFKQDNYKRSLNGYKIYAVKSKNEPSNEYRLFLTIDINLDLVVYLYLNSRPYDDWDQWDWESVVIRNLINFYLSEKQNPKETAGIWSWL